MTVWNRCSLCGFEWTDPVPCPRCKGQGMTPDQKIAGLQLQVKALQKALGTLLTWLPQSANSPIRQDEAMRLLNIMNQTGD